MAQLIMLIIVTVFFKLLVDIYKEQMQNKKDPRHTPKKGEVIDLSNAWIDLEEMPYNQRDNLFSGRELALCKLLEAVLPDHYVILPRVRLADFISVSPDARNRVEYANQIKERSADILICEASNFKPVAAVVFDSRTEGKKKQLADRFTRKAYEAAGLPYLDLQPADPPSHLELKKALQKAGLSI